MFVSFILIADSFAIVVFSCRHSALPNQTMVATSLLQQHDVDKEVEVGAKEITDNGDGDDGPVDDGRCRR